MLCRVIKSSLSVQNKGPSQRNYEKLWPIKTASSYFALFTKIFLNWILTEVLSQNKLHSFLQKEFCCLNNRMDCYFVAFICFRDLWQPRFSPLVVFVASNWQLKNTYSLRSSAKTATKNQAIATWHCFTEEQISHTWIKHSKWWQSTENIARCITTR